MTRLPAGLAIVLAALTAPRARGEELASAGVEPASSELAVDVIGSMRVGIGWSTLLDARILSLSLEDQVRVYRLSRSLGATVIFGLDGQRPLDFDSPRRGFLATTLGGGFLLHDAPGPAFTLGLTAAPLWQSRDDTTYLVGFGAGLRAEAYPFYQSVSEAVQCRRGWVSTYVLSGLHVFVLGRRDFIGVGGESYAAGLGLDLARNVILPVLGAMLPAACAK